MRFWSVLCRSIASASRSATRRCAAMTWRSCAGSSSSSRGISWTSTRFLNRTRGCRPSLRRRRSCVSNLDFDVVASQSLLVSYRPLLSRRCPVYISMTIMRLKCALGYVAQRAIVGPRRHIDAKIQTNKLTQPSPSPAPASRARPGATPSAFQCHRPIHIERTPHEQITLFP